MDYKYIEQLLEQYWECQTSREEEAILRSFFAQDDVPASLLPYKALFQAEEELTREACLDGSFDRKMMDLIDGRSQNAVSARRATLSLRLRPFYKVAAMLAVVLSLGMAAQYGWKAPEAPEMASQDNPDADSSALAPIDAATATATPSSDSVQAVVAQ